MGFRDFGFRVYGLSGLGLAAYKDWSSGFRGLEKPTPEALESDAHMGSSLNHCPFWVLTIVRQSYKKRTPTGTLVWKSTPHLMPGKLLRTEVCRASAFGSALEGLADEGGG